MGNCYHGTDEVLPSKTHVWLEWKYMEIALKAAEGNLF